MQGLYGKSVNPGHHPCGLPAGTTPPTRRGPPWSRSTVGITPIRMNVEGNRRLPRPQRSRGHIGTVVIVPATVHATNRVVRVRQEGPGTRPHRTRRTPVATILG